MKRVIGIVLLALALLGAAGVVRNWSRSGISRPLGSEAYERGREAGKYTAPVIVLLLGVAGIVLLLPAQPRSPIPPVTHGQQQAAVGSPKPWYKTTPAIVAFALVGGALALLLAVTVLVAVFVVGHSHRSVSYSPQAAQNDHNQDANKQATWNESGPYKAGSAVSAHWAGKWIPGTINKVNPGGFSVMVQLEDQRFPQPIVMSTNQLQLR